jgi:diacylglycerol kinase family enzyme
LRVLLIVNATASSVSARGRVVIQKALSADHDVMVAETTRRGHAQRLALGAANEGADAVVVLGGDGTLNEAANGLVRTGCALGVLPGGSTNVFARTIGLPNDPVESVGVLLESMEQQSTRHIGLGSANGRYFLFHAGMGFDAAVVEQVEKRSTLKRWAGHPLFAYSAVATWLRHYDRRHPPFRVEVPGGPEGGVDGYFTIALNTDPYTYLGNRPLQVTDEAGLEQPLAVLTLKSMRLTAVTGLFTAALGVGGPVGRRRSVDLRTRVMAASVVGHRPFPYQLDGDHLGAVDRVDLAWEPDVLRLFVPV